MLKDYFEVPNKPAIKSGNILSCDFTDHETFIPQPLDYTRGTIATYVDCNGFIKMSGVSDTNLVTNGTFETPVDSNQWLNFGSPLIAERSQTVAYEGSFSYHIKGDSTNDGTQATATQFTGDYVIGDTIRVRAYIYPITASSNQIKSGVANSNRSITTAVGGLVLNQWNFIEYYAEITTASNNYVTFLISGTAGEFYLDNVSVNKVDVETPRIDYLTEINKSKELQQPSLLLEPQSTNLFWYSEEFSHSYWNKTNCTVQQSTITSPDGLQGSYKLIPDAGTGGNRSLGRNFNSLSNFHTFSVFARAGEYKYAILRTRNNPNVVVSFDLENGTFNVNESSAVYDADSAKIENYGNGWYRCSMTLDPSQADNVGQLYPSISVGITGNEINDFDGDGVSGIYVFGAQVEEQSYSTSYIPTSGSTVTRNQDVAYSAGQLGVFNMNEGTMFLEFQIPGKRDLNQTSITVSTGGSSNRLLFFRGSNGSTYQIQLKQSGSNVYSATCGVDREDAIGKFVKVAWRFVSGNGSVYTNGVKTSQTSTDTATYPDFPTTSIQKFAFTAAGNTTSNPFYGRIKQVKVFRRGLTDSELQELTNNIV